MGRRRWRERRAPRNPLAASFDFDPWRPHEPDPQPPEPEPSPRLVEHNTRVLEVLKAVGIRGEDVIAPRLLCGADLGDGLTCRRWAGHERVGPDCSSMTITSWLAGLGTHPKVEGLAVGAGAVAGIGSAIRAAAAEQERAAAEQALNDGTSYFEWTAPAYGVVPGQTEDDRVIAEGIDQVIQADLKKAFDELPAVSNPAPGLWEIVTGKPLPSYTELVERGRRAEHPTYDLLNVQSTRAPELSSAEACDRLAAAIDRPRLAARITEVLPPALASQLALAVEEAVRRGVRAHVEAEKAVLNQLAEGATARLQQSIEDQKRGRKANAERWTTPSRLS